MKRFAAVLLATSAIACGERNEGPRPAASAAADAEAASPLDRSYRLKGGELLDVDRLFELLPDRFEVSYDTAELDEKSGATVVTDLRLADPRKGRLLLSVDRAEFFGVDLDAVDRVTEAASAAPDAALEPVLARVRLHGVSGAEANADGEPLMTIGAVEIDRLRVRRGGLPAEPSGSGLAHLFNAFDVAGLYFKDIRIDAAPDAQMAIGLRIPDLRFVGIGGGRIAAIVARKLDYRIVQPEEAIAESARALGPAGLLLAGPWRAILAPGDYRSKIAIFEWRDIDLSGLMEWGLKGEPPPVSARDLIDLGTIKARDLETFIGEERLSVIPEAIVSAFEFTWLAPSKVRAFTRGDIYDFTAYFPDTEEDIIAVLEAHGLDHVRGGSDFALDWDAGSGEAAISTGFHSDRLFEFDFDLAADGFELAKIDAARKAGDERAAAGLGRLEALTIAVEDKKMLDAFYELSALEGGGAPEDMRTGVPAMIRLTGAGMKEGSPRLASALGAIADFLEFGGRLELKAAPETPVPFAVLQARAEAGGPEAVAESVDLTATHRK